GVRRPRSDGAARGRLLGRGLRQGEEGEGGRARRGRPRARRRGDLRGVQAGAQGVAVGEDQEAPVGEPDPEGGRPADQPAGRSQALRHRSDGRARLGHSVCVHIPVSEEMIADTRERMRTDMIRLIRIWMAALVALTVVVAPPIVHPVFAASARALDRESAVALQNLYASQPVAKMLSERAKAILVFPTMVKAGFMFGGQIGEGALRKRGRTVAYYNSVAASYGFQAGLQTFGYALFFMTDPALNYLDASGGFEIGVGDLEAREDNPPGRVYSKHRDRRPGYRQIDHQLDARERRLRLHLRPEGPDGGGRHPGLEDHQDRQVEGGSRCHSFACCSRRSSCSRSSP